MSEIKKIFSRLGIVGLGLVIFGVIMTWLCISLYVNMVEKRHDLDLRGYQALEKLGKNMKRTDTLVSRIMVSYASDWFSDSLRSRKSNQGYGEIAKNLRDFKPADTKDTGVLVYQATYSPKTNHRADIRADKQVTGKAGQQADKQDTLRRSFPIGKFLEPMLQYDLFCDYIIFRNQSIAFSTLPGDVRMLCTDLLTGKDVPQDEDATASLASGKQETKKNTLYLQAGIMKKIQLRGSDYMLYVIPLKFRNSNDWYIGGLIAENTYAATVRDLPSFLVVIFIFGLLILLFCLPIAKVFILSPQEQLTAPWVTMLGVSIVTGTVLLVSLLNQQFIMNQVRISEYGRLKNLSTAVTKSFEQERRSILDRMTAIDRYPWHMDSLPVRVTSVLDSGRSIYQPFRSEGYPFYKAIFWADQAGTQTRYITPFLKGAMSRVTSREYFTRPDRYLVDSTWYNMEPIYSQTTGDWSVAVSSPSVRPGTRIIALTAAMYSLKQPLLKKGFSYILVGSGGKIWFHSDEVLDLSDNILDECHGSKRLINAMNSREETDLGLVLRNKKYLAHVAPVSGTDLFLVTLADPARANSIPALMAIFVLAFFGIIFIGMSLVYLVIRYLRWRPNLLPGHNYFFQWILPDPRHEITYLQMTRFNGLLILSLIVLMFFWNLPEIPLPWLLGILGAIVVLHCILTFNVLRFKIKVWKGKSRIIPTGITTRYVIFATSWLVAAVILPVILISMRVFYEEAASHIQREQEHLGKRMNERNESLFRFYRENIPSPMGYWTYRERVREGNYYIAADSTRLFPLTGNTASETGHTTSWLMKSARFVFDLLMNEAEPLSASSLAGSSFLIHNNTISTYFDGVDFEKSGTKTVGRYKLVTRDTWQDLFKPTAVGCLGWLAMAYWTLVLLFILATAFLLKYLARALFLPEQLRCHDRTMRQELKNLDAARVNAIFISAGMPDTGQAERVGWLCIDLAAGTESEKKKGPGKALLVNFGAGTEAFSTMQERIAALRRHCTDRQVVLWLDRSPEQLIETCKPGWEKQTDKDRPAALAQEFLSLAGTWPRVYPVAKPHGLETGDLCSRFSSILRAEATFNPGIRVFTRLLVKEFSRSSCPHHEKCHSASLENLPCRPAGEGLIIRIRELSANYYAGIWNALSPAEKFLLLDLAQDGLVNLKNRAVICLLLKKGILQQKDLVSFASASFRDYILTSVDDVEKAKLTLDAGQNGNWGRLKMPLTLVVVSILMLLFITRQNFLSGINSILVSVGTVVAVYLRFSGLFAKLKGGASGQ